MNPQTVAHGFSFIEIMNAISPWATLLIGAILSMLVWGFKTTVTERISENNKKIDELVISLTKLKEEILREYVTKKDFQENGNAHENLWKEIRLMQGDIREVQTIQDMYKERIENLEKQDKVLNYFRRDRDPQGEKG